MDREAFDSPAGSTGDLREAFAYWAEANEPEEPTEEERLSKFLQSLNKSDEGAQQAVNNSAQQQVGRRSAPRLRLSLPARFTSVENTHKCILLNISRTGAQIAILNSIREGEGGILDCGKLQVFAIVARSEFSLNALQFDEELSHEDVLEMRRYYENFEERERRILIETAKKWVKRLNIWS